MRRGFLTTSVALMALVAGSQTAFAQAGPAAEETADADSGDIVVTAQRRSESLQKVPLAVSAIGAADLANTGRSTLESFSADVPGLNVTQNIGQARVTLRGIGVDNISLGSEGSVAFYQDGVFYARSSAAFASMYDIERIEVLRGPQGTLYGRNATGGSINILTAKPTDQFEGYLAGTIGNYLTLNSEGAISGPLSDNVSARLSFQTKHHRGYGRNTYTGTRIDDENSQGVRGQIKFDFNPLTILIAGDYFRKDDNSNGGHYFGPGVESAPGVFDTPLAELLGGTVATDIRDVSNARDPFAKAEFYGGRIDMSYDASDTVSLRSLTAYRASDFDSLTDISGSSFDLFPLYNYEYGRQFSQEFQVNVTTDRHKLVVGAYYLHDKVNGGSYAPFAFLGGTYDPVTGQPQQFFQGYSAGGIMKTDALAFFAQDTFSLSDSVRLTVGGRYSWEKKNVDNFVEFDFTRFYDPSNPVLAPHRLASKSWSSFTPKIGIDVDLGPNTMAYASFSKGFKAGTYDLQALIDPVDPEKIDSYDVGIKTTMADGAVRLNLAGFYYDYTNLQTGKVTGATLVLENAASAEIYGVEGELTIRPRSIPLTISANGSLLSAKYTTYISQDPARLFGDGTSVDEDGFPAFNLAGNRLPQAPSYTFNLGADYEIETGIGKLTLHADSQWIGRTWHSAFNRQVNSQAPYSLQNAFISLHTESDWTLTAFIRNIGDKKAISSAHVGYVPIGGPILGYVIPPRTFGLTIRKDF